MKKSIIIPFTLLIAISLSACSSDTPNGNLSNVATISTIATSSEPSSVPVSSEETSSEQSSVAESSKETPSSKIQKQNKQEVDITGWALYDTGDPATLAEYLIDGLVVEYNGQYYASPKLEQMLGNENVVYIHDIANDSTSSERTPTGDSKLDGALAEQDFFDGLNGE